MSVVSTRKTLIGQERSMQIRILRADMRRRLATMPLASGRLAIADLLEENPDWLGSAFLDVVLLWPSRMTQDEAWHLIWSIGCRQRRIVSELTDRQRTLLATYLRGNRA